MDQSYEIVDKQTEFVSQPIADFSAYSDITELVEKYRSFADTNDPSSDVMKALQKRCVELIIMRDQEEASEDKTHELAVVDFDVKRVLKDRFTQSGVSPVIYDDENLQHPRSPGAAGQISERMAASAMEMLEHLRKNASAVCRSRPSCV